MELYTRFNLIKSFLVNLIIHKLYIFSVIKFIIVLSKSFRIFISFILISFKVFILIFSLKNSFLISSFSFSNILSFIFEKVYTIVILSFVFWIYIFIIKIILWFKIKFMHYNNKIFSSKKAKQNSFWLQN